MSALWRDLRYALRALRRSPGFALVAILTLAIGIGATAAIFSAIDGILLRPPPYPDSDRLVVVMQTDVAAGGDPGDVAPGNFLDWRERSRSFEVLAAVEPFGMDYMGPEGPQALPTWRVSEGFFRVAGVPALLGRTFEPSDHVPGAVPVVVFGHDRWLESFGGDPGLVGRTLDLDGTATTVVGVMPPGFELPSGRDVWTPKTISEAERDFRTTAYWQVFGKLAPEAGIEAAQDDMARVARELAQELPSTNAGVGAVVVPLRNHLVQSVRGALLLLFAAVGLVLLIACANVANLLMARAARRERELAVRTALGATRGRLLGQLATESLVLAALGSLGGLFLAWMGIAALQTLSPAGIPRLETLAIDLRVVTFAIVLAGGTALLFGLAPALHASRTDLRRRIGAGVSASPQARRFRSGLVVAELALATVLLIGAGLLGRSFAAVLDVDRGYASERVLALSVQTWQYYPTGPNRAAFVAETVERVARLPGVEAAGVTSSLPLTAGIGPEQATYVVHGASASLDGDEHTTLAAVVTDGYFDALRIPLRSGRRFTPEDRADAVPVALVDETFAWRLWPGEEALGRRLTVRFAGPPRDVEIVGVVGTVRHRDLEEDPRPIVYLSHAQFPTGALHFTVRTTADPLSVVGAAQDEIWVMNPTMPISAVTTLDALVADAVRERRFGLVLLFAFAGCALVLAAVGTYGLLSYEAGRRSGEIGLRIALGAGEGRVIRMVVGQGLAFGVAGVLLGAALTFPFTRGLSAYLFGVGAADPLTTVVVGALLVGVAALASYLPARRAANVDPMVALRTE